ncbi:MAG: MFS transporter [Sphingomonas sp.]
MSTMSHTRTPDAEARQAGAPQGLTLAVAGFLPVLSILSLAPAVPGILKHFAGVAHAETLVPLMVTAPGLMVALLAPFAGALVDRYGRRRLILLATFLYGFAGVAPFFLSSLPAMFASRLVVGATEAFVLVIVNTLFADYFTTGRRRTWITVQGVSGPVLGIGSIAAAGALSAFAWNGAFLLYSVALVMFIAMVATLYEPLRVPHTDQSIAVGESVQTKTAFPVAVSAKFALVTFLSSLIYYVFIVQSGLAFEASGVASSANLGLLIGVSSLGTPLGALLFNLVSRKAPSEVLIASFLLFMGVGMIGMGLARTPALMLVFGFIQQIGGGITVAGLIFWVSRLVPPEHRGRGFGIWSSAFFAGQFASPLLVGSVRFFTGGILGAFVACGAIAVVGALIVVALRRSLPQPL